MRVTLEVLKLSGWLNADADCRESNGGQKVRGEGAGQETGATASNVQWRLDCRLGAGRGEERTVNMRYMVVTLEVSQLETSASKFFKL